VSEVNKAYQQQFNEIMKMIQSDDDDEMAINEVKKVKHGPATSNDSK